VKSGFVSKQELNAAKVDHDMENSLEDIGMVDAVMQDASSATVAHDATLSPQPVERRRLRADPETAALALRAIGRRAVERQADECNSTPASSSAAPAPGADSAPPKPRLDASAEIERIYEAETPEEVLNLAPGEQSEEVVTQAWKQLMLLLHPDKLQRLSEELHAKGAEALDCVNNAKEELKRRQQEVSAEVPLEPKADGPARLLSTESGSRKIELKWHLPTSQEPGRPVEKYEIWGPKYFSEAGEPFDWVLLASIPPLQSHFVLVEEAPTQQDVMWAADRVCRSTLQLSVNATNGRGASTPLTFEVPWATKFPWLQGARSVLCPRCCQLSQRRGAWSKCGGCGFSIPAENSLVVRCSDCQGEVLWSHSGSQLSCSSCFKKIGGVAAKDTLKQPVPPSRPPPGHGYGTSRGSWGRTGGSRPGGRYGSYF
jgi:hypothetical protein